MLYSLCIPKPQQIYLAALRILTKNTVGDGVVISTDAESQLG
jgi:hypothetical protein